MDTQNKSHQPTDAYYDNISVKLRTSVMQQVPVP